ncbi:Macrolide export ATP-binding/permease protein MacB [Corynebacterium ciconiae DSM 44920]|uniref:ABC transporter permease n=1 Tax=Corynebacterium ciconiae TaxID=227319 RepID=UPI00036A606E|nr:ABC transporter permease [Corynebacterium ciconiae]WKD61028.1 Macrolide export ATP-binding/permease protein MacB [Corynebacterium ciconiae DSM 44920]
MTLGEAMVLALFNLRTNLLRTFLTLLGVIIGVAAVITILTLGASLNSSIKKTFEDLGGSDITVVVEPSAGEESDTDNSADDPFQALYSGSSNDDPDSGFSTDDIETLKARLGASISGVGIGAGQSASHYAGAVTVSSSEPTDAAIAFVNADGFSFGKQRVVAGRGITEEDARDQRMVAVVPEKLIEKYFDGNASEALGQEISFGWEDSFFDVRVVGVYSQDETPLVDSGNTPAQLYLPYSVAPLTVAPGEPLMWSNIVVRAADGVEPDTVRAEIDRTVATMWNNREGYQARTLDFSSVLEESNKITNMLSAALAAIAGISLLVGGIGVMNIMLITVTERTREIGIRKALGATAKDIRTQFVVEAMMVCLAGGLVGVLAGGVFGLAGSAMMRNPVLPPIGGIVFSLLFCLAIGLFFGWYPARRAAKLNPIEALRYE